MLTRIAIRAVPSTLAPGRSPEPRAHGLAGSLAMIGACMPFARNTEVYAEDEPADYLYKVASGAIRTSKLLSDGRRQIGAFHLPGDVFGLEAGREHHFSAEAIVDSKVLVIKRSAGHGAGGTRQRRCTRALGTDGAASGTRPPTHAPVGAEDCAGVPRRLSA